MNYYCILNNILKWKWKNNKFITNYALKYIIEVGGSTDSYIVLKYIPTD